MLVIQVALGGITRLTGSGLSITEWKPILGAVPPLNDTDWNAAFQKYQGIAQYQYLNQDFTLSDFKAIYFWEWMHREWARLMGLVFIVGFTYFLARRRLDKSMVQPFVILFILGGLQGAIGWIMVASGLNDTDLYVSHIRLAVHFIAALVLVGYTFWFALKLRVPDAERIQAKGLQKATLALIAVLTVQLVYGAFMAGLKAAQSAPTWPGINGSLIPASIHSSGGRTFSTLQAITDHPLAVHFVHRTLAALLVILTLMWTLRARALARSQDTRTALRRWWTFPAILIAVQALLGILTVRTSPRAIHNGFGIFELLAEAHQLVAMTFLLTLLAALYAVTGRRTVSA
jgi:cytochrome c oxidase assembly protein subunit 15